MLFELFKKWGVANGEDSILLWRHCGLRREVLEQKKESSFAIELSFGMIQIFRTAK
jgi:hypothetical protein